MPRSQLVLMGGVALLGLGTAVMLLGVIIAPLFLPGVYLIAAALLVLAAGGFLVLLGSDAPRHD